MDYEQKYKKALERAKYCLTTDMDDSGHWAVKHIFPELKESEDVKEKLIKFFQRYPYKYIADAEMFTKDAIEWLEKLEPIECMDSGVKEDIEAQEKSEFEKQFEAYMYHPETDEKIMAACCKKLLELAKKELMKEMVIPSVIHSIQYSPSCFEDGGACTNLHHDCIICPKRNNTGGFITTTNNYGK